MIFGESIFNDAISIVMYRTVYESTTRSESLEKEILLSVADFCVILLGSLLIGACSALLSAYILKR